MATHADLVPEILKPSLTTNGGADLKPSITTSAYGGGVPSAANQVKPSVVHPDGTLKDSWVYATDIVKQTRRTGLGSDRVLHFRTQTSYGIDIQSSLAANGWLLRWLNEDMPLTPGDQFTFSYLTDSITGAFRVVAGPPAGPAIVANAPVVSGVYTSIPFTIPTGENGFIIQAGTGGLSVGAMYAFLEGPS